MNKVISFYVCVCVIVNKLKESIEHRNANKEKLKRLEK